MLKYIIIVLAAAIAWILYSKTQGFNNVTRVSISKIGFRRFFSFEAEKWNTHWLKVVTILSAILAVMCYYTFG
jgi:hypothetical protein